MNSDNADDEYNADNEDELRFPELSTPDVVRVPDAQFSVTDPGLT